MKIGSDYYTPNEDPLIGSTSFKKKKKKPLAGQKRLRADEDDNDIIAQLEGNSSNQQPHLATKAQRREAVDKAIVDESKQEEQKMKRFETAFDRIKQRNKNKKPKP